MRLRIRGLLFIGVISMCFLVGIYKRGSRADLEQRHANQDPDRTSRAYIQADILDRTLIELQTDLILYIDTRGNLYYARSVQHPDRLPPLNPNSVLRLLKTHRSISLSGNRFHGVGGRRVYPLIGSVRPTFTSTGKRPARGWLVFRRYFDEAELEALCRRTPVVTWLFDSSELKLPEDCRQAMRTLTETTPRRIRPKTDRSVGAGAPLRVVQNRLSPLPHLHKPRIISQQGFPRARFLAVLIALAVFLFDIFIFLVLKKTTFSRRSSQNGQVEGSGSGRQGLSRVLLSGRDKRGHPSRKINGMLGEHEVSDQSAGESEENLEEVVEERRYQYCLRGHLWSCAQRVDWAALGQGDPPTGPEAPAGCASDDAPLGAAGTAEAEEQDGKGDGAPFHMPDWADGIAT